MAQARTEVGVLGGMPTFGVCEWKTKKIESHCNREFCFEI